MLPLDILTTLELPEKLVNDCRAMLEQQSSGLLAVSPRDVRGGAFGPSDTGSELGHHATIANSHVVDALNQMAVGLQGYSENLGDFARDLGGKDSNAPAVLSAPVTRELDENVACTTSPDYKNTATCEVPSVKGDED